MLSAVFPDQAAFENWASPAVHFGLRESDLGSDPRGVAQRSSGIQAHSMLTSMLILMLISSRLPQ